MSACVAPIAALGCVSQCASQMPAASGGAASGEGAGSPLSETRSPPSTSASQPMWGITLDDVDTQLPDTVAALASLPVRPTARIVFDPGRMSSSYAAQVRLIQTYAVVMGELLDSSAVSRVSVRGYRERAAEYVTGLPEVDIWEIANEANGEWLGPTAEVVAKIEAAYRVATAHGKRTALTLYYNESCWTDPAHEMFRWAGENLPESVRHGVTYALISYYEDDCNGRQPDWPAVFTRLAELFPHARIGIGECGTKIAERKSEYIRRYYGMKIPHPQYVGGYFWWYFGNDMVPRTRPLWTVLSDAIAGASTSGPGSRRYSRASSLP